MMSPPFICESCRASSRASVQPPGWRKLPKRAGERTKHLCGLCWSADHCPPCKGTGRDRRRLCLACLGRGSMWATVGVSG